MAVQSDQQFSQYLLDKYRDDFTTATEHPFLVSAGKGTLDQDVLVGWLRQDYLYAYVGYIKFASILISRLPYPTTAPPPSASSREHTLHKALSVLIFSLSNVKRETGFFVQTAKEYGLELLVDGVLPPVSENGTGSGLLSEYNQITKSYVEYLHAVAATGTLEEGLVVLWAMEKAYYTAWSHAKSHRPSPEPKHTPAQRALCEFIDNWTNEEFVGFVNDCEELVDGLIGVDSDLKGRCEEAFKRIIWLEQRFWPTV